MKTDELRNLVKEEIARRPATIFVFAHLCNLIEATAKQRHLENGRNLQRTKECDLEQLKTYESTVALIEGLIETKDKEGAYDGIRRGAD